MAGRIVTLRKATMLVPMIHTRVWKGSGVYNLTGFFPQAGRNWMGTVVLRF